MTSRFDSLEPTDNLLFLPRAITQALRDEPSSTTDFTIVVGDCRKIVLVSRDGCGRPRAGGASNANPPIRISAATPKVAIAKDIDPLLVEIGATAAMPDHSRPAVILSSTGCATGIPGSLR